MAPTRWTRDLPFLRVAAERLDTAVPALIATQFANEVGLTPEECFAAARSRPGRLPRRQPHGLPAGGSTR